MKAGNFTLHKFEPSQRSAWDSVVRASKNGNFLHLRDYLEYHARRYVDSSLIVYKCGRPVAVFPCNRVNNQIMSHGGLTYAGLIYGTSFRAVDVLELFEQICDYFKQAGIASLTYKAIPHVFHRYPAEEDLYALYRLGARLFRRDLSTVIQLPNRLRWSELRRRAIRNAERNNLIVREGNFLSEFHEILSSALEKCGTSPVHSLQELQLLQSRFTKEIRLFGTFSAARQLLAGVLIYDFGHIVHTQYLAASEEGKQLGALDLLLARIIEAEFSQRQYFSFGISTEQSGHYLNEGLVFQKEGFGGRAVLHDFYELGL